MGQDQSMNMHRFAFRDTTLAALPSGALFWPAHGMLVVSDLHFGKSARLSAVGGAALPPYETRATLERLAQDLAATGARHVVCLGDSFDSVGIDRLLPACDRDRLSALQAGRRWDWVEGNHDPGPVSLGGTHRAELAVGGIVMRHAAQPGAVAEISGHYHPKLRLTARGRSLSRPCFLLDEARLILPAYGAYTGGLWADSPALSRLMGPGARAILTGDPPRAVPLPHRARA